ncbi:major facilitator superfamily domain-containing protein YCR023C [Trichomonascus vanleenenianus]|uniref:MFS transporter n=1 Tax=Trichomonascus vanleenenianus TaxID=2268995 RepID=UPI003EC98F59
MRSSYESDCPLLDEHVDEVPSHEAEEEEEEVVEEASYWNLPKRNQIYLLFLCRLSEPIAYSAVSPYLYYMIRDFGYDKPSTIASLGTFVMVSFAFAQTMTSLWWGRFADRVGRKPTLCMGLMGTAFTLLAFGFSTNIYMAIGARMCTGLLNSNAGVMRTMVAEIVGRRKEHQVRAFSLMPMAMNIGMIIGPIVGGYLANPVESYPKLFGGSQLLRKYPYALPNLVMAPLLLLATAVIVLFIEETSSNPRALLHRSRDPGLKLGKWLAGRPAEHEAVPGEEPEVEMPNYDDEEAQSPDEPQKPIISVREILTDPVKITAICYFMLMFHCSAFIQMLPIFLSTPRMEDSHNNPFIFNGGLGLPTSTIGSIVSVLGLVAILLQVLIYPRLASKLGNARIHKLALLVFPVTYFIMPYLSFLPDNSSIITYVPVVLVAAFGMLGRTFSLPPLGVLVTNSAPSYTVMGTVQGLSQSVTSAARCLGPLVLGNIYSLGVRIGVVSLAWWVGALFVVAEIIYSRKLKEWDEEEKKAPSKLTTQSDAI